MGASARDEAAYFGVLQQFPPINWGFAYGSGVFKQPDLYMPGTPPRDGPMLDLVFVVDDPLEWHAENIRMNRHHYSSLASLGPRLVCTVADHAGVGVYFNTLVPSGQQYIKYGVVGLQPFLQDLSLWNHLYVAGRLHKPVRPLQPPRSVVVQQAVQDNLQSALGAALLLSPDTFSLRDLFKRITALSYTGDVRMGLAEDSRKVERIVAGSYQHFADLYMPLLQDAPSGVKLNQLCEEDWHQDTSDETRMRLLSRLPAALLQELGQRCGVASISSKAVSSMSSGSDSSCSSSLRTTGSEHRGTVTASSSNTVSSSSGSEPSISSPLCSGMAQREREAIAAAALRTGRYQQHLNAGLRCIVGKSSRRQAVAGLLTAGVRKSVQYVARKVAKAWKSS